jgi:hypothetical protein
MREYFRHRFPSLARWMERQHYVSTGWCVAQAQNTRVEYHGPYRRFPVPSRKDLRAVPRSQRVP